MWLRLLPLLTLVFLSQPSFTQQLGTGSPSTVPETCPVTSPSDHPFVPPQPYPVKPSEDDFWFGTDELWTNLPARGTWTGLPHYTPDDPTFREKLFFYRKGYDWKTEHEAGLIVTGKRLDAVAPPLLSDKANKGCCIYHRPFMLTGVNFPTVGCWQVSGHYHDRDLTFVVWIAK